MLSCANQQSRPQIDNGALRAVPTMPAVPCSNRLASLSQPAAPCCKHSVRCTVLTEIAGCRCMEIDVRIICLIVWHVGRTYFENARPGAGSILQVMAIGITREKSGALACAQGLLAAFCNEDNLSLYDVYKLLRLRMPVSLARPSTRFQFKKIDADLFEPRRYRQPMSNLVLTRRVERLWISRASRNGRACNIDPLHADLAFLPGLWTEIE
jgi:hypothetical protein